MQKESAKLREEEAEILKKQAELKTILYAKFKDNINLEEE